MSEANVIFSSSYWRIYRKNDFCILCFYRFREGQAHVLETQQVFPDLSETLKQIDLAGVNYPVILTTGGKPFIGL